MKCTVFIFQLFYLHVVVSISLFFKWQKIKHIDPFDITIPKFDDCNLDISHEFEIMESEIQDESDNEEESESLLKNLEQYEEKSKSNLEEIEIINIGTEIEIPTLRMLMETKLDEADWIKQCHEQLSLIDEKRLNAICHGQYYQKRMARAYKKKIKP